MINFFPKVRSSRELSILVQISIITVIEISQLGRDRKLQTCCTYSIGLRWRKLRPAVDRLMFDCCGCVWDLCSICASELLCLLSSSPRWKRISRATLLRGNYNFYLLIHAYQVKSNCMIKI